MIISTRIVEGIFERAVLRHGKWYFFTKSVFQSYQVRRAGSWGKPSLIVISEDTWKRMVGIWSPGNFGGQGTAYFLLLVLGSAKLQNNWILFQSQMFILFVSSRFFEYSFYRYSPDTHFQVPEKIPIHHDHQVFFSIHVFMGQVGKLRQLGHSTRRSGNLLVASWQKRKLPWRPQTNVTNLYKFCQRAYTPQV